MYILGNNLFTKLINRHITNIPSKFCCFVVSNPKCTSRNKMFEYLCKYKKVDSCGKYANNMGYDIIHMNWWSIDYIKYISQYKFMICFENTLMEAYSTEKIVNAYLANTIPIYWGTNDIFNIFNKDSIIYLNGETHNDYVEVVNKVIELDNNSSLYLNFINQPIFNNNNIDYWNSNFTLQVLGNKINQILA